MQGVHTLKIYHLSMNKKAQRLFGKGNRKKWNLQQEIIFHLEKYCGWIIQRVEAVTRVSMIIKALHEMYFHYYYTVHADCTSAVTVNLSQVACEEDLYWLHQLPGRCKNNENINNNKYILHLVLTLNHNYFSPMIAIVLFFFCLFFFFQVYTFNNTLNGG